MVSRQWCCSNSPPVLRSCRQDLSASRLMRLQKQAPLPPNGSHCVDGCGGMPGAARGCCASLRADACQSTFLMQTWQQMRQKQQQQQTQVSQQALGCQPLRHLLRQRRRH